MISYLITKTFIVVQNKILACLEFNKKELLQNVTYYMNNIIRGSQSLLKLNVFSRILLSIPFLKNFKTLVRFPLLPETMKSIKI